jgi:hypothetical protein
MKKFVFILLLSLGWIEVVGQVKYPPILPRRENDYTIQELRVFINSGSLLATSWKDSVVTELRLSLVEILGEVKDPRQALATSRALTELDRRGIDYILDNSVLEYVELKNFQNSYQDTIVKFYPDKNFKGMAHVFKIENFFSQPLSKGGCANALKAGFVFLVSESPPSTNTTIPLDVTPTPDFSSEDEERFNSSPFIPKEKFTPISEQLVKKKRAWIAPVAIIGGGIVITVVTIIIKSCLGDNSDVETYEIRTMPKPIP